MNGSVKDEQIASLLEINKERLREWHACTSGYEWFLNHFPQGGMFIEVYNALREDRRYQDSEWLADRVCLKLDPCTKVAQLVSITGADEGKIEQLVKEYGGKEGEVATTGEGANAATTGYGASADTTGKHAVATALGIKGKAKAGVGGAIVLCYRNDNGDLIHLRASKVDENGIQPDVWYALDEDGEFVEVEA
jgi:hypothetical protein